MVDYFAVIGLIRRCEVSVCSERTLQVVFYHEARIITLFWFVLPHRSTFVALLLAAGTPETYITSAERTRARRAAEAVAAATYLVGQLRALLE